MDKLVNSLSRSCSDLPFFICPPRVPSWKDDKEEENDISLADEGPLPMMRTREANHRGLCRAFVTDPAQWLSNPGAEAPEGIPSPWLPCSATFARPWPLYSMLPSLLGCQWVNGQNKSRSE